MLGELGQKPRPKSSLTPRKYRFKDNDQLNGLKASIHEVFSRDNKSVNQIKYHTADRVEEKYSKKLNLICQKYSIVRNQRNRSMSETVDVDLLVKDYAIKKAIEQQKRQRINKMRRQIQNTTTRNEKKKAKPFFIINKLNLQSFSQGKSISASNIHPYLVCYEQQQLQTLVCLTQGNKVKCDFDTFPELQEKEEWEVQYMREEELYSRMSGFKGRSGMRRKVVGEGGGGGSQFFITNI